MRHKNTFSERLKNWIKAFLELLWNFCYNYKLTIAKIKKDLGDNFNQKSGTATGNMFSCHSTNSACWIPR